MKLGKLRVGDVLELAVGQNFVYLNFLGKHREYGECLLLSNHRHESPISDFSSEFQSSYVVFYPASIALKRNLMAIKGNIQAPSIPTELRRAGGRSGTRILNWIIEDGQAERLVEQLSKKQQSLPIAAIWNHEMLLFRISEHWKPEMEIT